jgi:DNA-binding transcriptional LysR family regulator
LNQLGKLQDHIEKLRVLNYVGRMGSITKAAAAIHLTQAAASQSIRVLEDILGVKLLFREARGVQLTESGRVLFEFSQRLLSEIQGVEAKTINPFSSGGGVLKIGTHETLAIHVWPPVFEKFSDVYPDTVVSLISGRIDDLVSGILNRDHQIILSVEPLKHPRIKIEEVYAGRMGIYANPAAAAKRYPSLKKKKITVAEANLVPMMTDAAAHIRQGLPIPVFLMENGFTLDKFFELNSFEAAMRLAMRGFGLAVVPTRNAELYVKQKLLTPITITEVHDAKFGAHRICASILKDQVEQPIIRQFFQMTLDHCRVNASHKNK